MTVIKFPDKEYILRCHRCKSNSFYIILDSENWTDIKGFECAECSSYTEFLLSSPCSQNTFIEGERRT